jgi:serine/threonine protein kinase
MTEPAAEQDPLIGKTLRSYRIQEPIGAGRWGKVYRAFQSSMNRTAAVRILSPEVAALPGRAGQFLEKSRTEAQLNHPHLVIIYEAGQADGKSFCAMEYMDGPPLREFLRKGHEVDERRLLQTVIGVARAVDFLWQRQIQHQPPLEENVLTTTDGIVKLINIEPVQEPASQSPHEDLLKLGLIVAARANDIAPVSKPVSKFVERMLGAAGREPCVSLAEAVETAEALDRKLFTPEGATRPKVEIPRLRQTKPLAVLVIGFVALLLVAILGWFWWRSLSH